MAADAARLSAMADNVSKRQAEITAIRERGVVDVLAYLTAHPNAKQGEIYNYLRERGYDALDADLILEVIMPHDRVSTLNALPFFKRKGLTPDEVGAIGNYYEARGDRTLSDLSGFNTIDDLREHAIKERRVYPMIRNGNRYAVMSDGRVKNVATHVVKAESIEAAEKLFRKGLRQQGIKAPQTVIGIAKTARYGRPDEYLVHFVS